MAAATDSAGFQCVKCLGQGAITMGSWVLRFHEMRLILLRCLALSLAVCMIGAPHVVQVSFLQDVSSGASCYFEHARA